jgi:hypothetical protein
MLSPQLRPFRELILAARSIHLCPDAHELGLQLPLLGCGFWGDEIYVEVP